MLTKNQEKCLYWIKLHGVLTRHHGGYWSYPGVEMIEAWGNHNSYIPKEHLPTGTIKSLIDRGLIYVSNSRKSNQPPYNDYAIEVKIKN